MQREKYRDQICNYDNSRKLDLPFDPHTFPDEHKLTTYEALSIYDYGYFRAMEQVREHLIFNDEALKVIISNEVNEIFMN